MARQTGEVKNLNFPAPARLKILEMNGNTGYSLFKTDTRKLASKKPSFL